MNWEQIKEVSSYDFAYIGNHSHTHEYLLNFSHIEFEKDIKNSINQISALDSVTTVTSTLRVYV